MKSANRSAKSANRFAKSANRFAVSLLDSKKCFAFFLVNLVASSKPCSFRSAKSANRFAVSLSYIIPQKRKSLQQDFRFLYNTSYFFTSFLCILYMDFHDCAQVHTPLMFCGSQSHAFSCKHEQHDFLTLVSLI